MNIVIPMAGAGSRFANAGYTFPKPLIEVRGKPMIQVIVENLSVDGRYIYIVLKQHYEKYLLKYMLNMITPGCEIIVVDHLTDGAACTVLLARELFEDNQPLLIANSDQWVEWNSKNFIRAVNGMDGGILTFKCVHPKCSFAKNGEDGFVAEVAEKKVISNIATVGIYYWGSGNAFAECADEMIRRDIRTNNEFYVAPVYNHLIENGGRVVTYDVIKNWGLGTPEDLNYFLEHNNANI